MIDESKFSTKEELFKHLVDNQKELIAQKKFEMKKADAVSFSLQLVNEKGEAIKANTNINELLAKDELKALLIINTTNIMDSHKDVHINGLWKKSLNDNKFYYHIQEHQMKFSYIINDQAKAYTKTYSWKELGFDADGETQALVFDSTIRKVRNQFMFEQYAKGFVKNHSVGMRYVQLFLCVNSDDTYYEKEKANWDKYINNVVNKQDAEESGYFWAVTEAKLVEGSAVVVGSNRITPTQSLKSFEPSTDTQKNNNDGEPSNSLSLFAKLSKINTKK